MIEKSHFSSSKCHKLIGIQSADAVISANKPETLEVLLKRVRACIACKDHLPYDPHPIIQASKNAKLLIIGQAPGVKAHNSGVPWDDDSGERLRDWLGIPYTEFYNERTVAIIPMGFCYPGTRAHGDLPPRKECFSLWHEKLITKMPFLKLTVLVGSYAQAAYLKGKRESSLTKTVCAWRSYLPYYLPIPHPSPRNNIWLHKNRWFQEDELPKIKTVVHTLLNSDLDPSLLFT